ncbi:MAG: hypothetical protein RI897_4588 [Verrucomicrobiota bacterium]|jgi:vacuolar-type H+-ATPase subunit E/Vma4
MDKREPNSSERLCESVLVEARERVHGLTVEAQQRAGEILSQAEEEGRGLVRAAEEEAAAEGARKRAALLAAVSVRVERRRSAHVEGVLEGIRRDLVGRVADEGSVLFRCCVLRGVREAVGRMDGDEFVVCALAGTWERLGSVCMDELRGLGGEVGVSMRVVEDAGCVEGEVVVRDGVGRRIWRVDPLARVERAWPDLRRQVVAVLGWESADSGCEGGDEG